MKHYIKVFLWDNGIKFDTQKKTHTSSDEALIIRTKDKKKVINFLNYNKEIRKVEEKLDLIFIHLKRRYKK